MVSSARPNAIGALAEPDNLPSAALKMIHYHVWFDLKPQVTEVDGMAIVQRFLERLIADDEAATFQLLKNKGGPPRSKLGRYHALIQFTGDEQLSEAMRKQAARGIHSGNHGAVIDVVTNFHVEIFEALPAINSNANDSRRSCDI